MQHHNTSHNHTFNSLTSWISVKHASFALLQL